MANRVDGQKWDARLRAIGLQGKLPDRLTERVVEAAQKRPTGARYMLSDGKVPGLALAVYPDGAASYVLQVRTLGGIARRCGLGSAATVALEEARAEGERLRAVVKAGGDPIAQKASARSEAKAAQASTVQRYMADTYKPCVLAHRKDGIGTERRILASWKPLLETPLAQLTRENIEKVLAARKAETGPDGTRRLSNATLNRDWAVFRSMLADAVDRGKLAALPLQSKPEPLRGLGEEPRRRYMEQAEERSRFFKALAAFDSEEPGGGAFLRVACILAVNTGCRRGELVKLRDGMINLADTGNERIELPGAICKSGKGRDLILNPDAIAAIKEWREVRKTLKVQSVGGELFPGKAECWEDRISAREFPRLCEQSGIEDLVYHDLRRTFASLHVQTGTPLIEVQKMLGHASITTTERHYGFLAPSSTRANARAFRVA
jgi:integrase